MDLDKTLIETIMGGLVLLIALVFLLFAYNRGSVGTVSGYDVMADFDNVTGIVDGSDIRLGGIKIGTVSDINLNSETYQATMTLSIDDKIKLPTDTVAEIATEGLLGGHYLSLVPGAEEEYLEDGGNIVYTQSPVDIVQLLSKFMFSAGDAGKDQK
ncbi:MAG: outer membrane lipid asymmetry maintenance protein MlaD [Alphaproteobacteria bacterium]